MALEIPKRTHTVFIEHAGTYRDVELEDRPYRIVNQMVEHKGHYEDVKEYLSDTDILLAGGIKRFFNDDGSRRPGSWPYDPDVQPGPRKKKAKKRKSSK